MITIFNVFINEVELCESREVMKFEVLKKNNLKINIVIGGCVVLIISAVILNFSSARYRSTASVPIVNSEVNYSRPDLEIIALYINGEQASELDSSKKYALDTNNSTCTYKDGTAIDNLTLSYDSDTKTFSISPYTTRGTKCYLYFEEYIPSIKDTILSYYPTVLTRTDFSTTVTATTTGIIYKSADSSQYDNDGEVYYFAGNPTDNWVYFAGYYWRIIRINGDGTLRLIYNGTTTSQTGTGTQIGTSTFNSASNDNMYVGYMYTSGSVHGLGTSSTIKGVLDNWYTSNLSNYANYIDIDAGFCGDRTPYNGTGTGSEPTMYEPFNRIFNQKMPTLICSNNSDLYTVSSSSKGNKALIYPIGLITADEMSYVGAVSVTNNTGYYLYTGSTYWTMSPYGYGTGAAYVYLVNSSGAIYSGGTISVYSSEAGVRPVINLRADTQFQAGTTGTALNPFVIAT